MNWLLGTLFLVIAFYILNRYLTKKKYLKQRESLLQKWGKPKGKDAYFSFYHIRQYFDSKQKEQGFFQIISEGTAIDLDVESVFRIIDRTTSRIGQQYLYYKLRIIQHVGKRKHFESLTSIFRIDASLRLKVQLALSNLRHHDVYDLNKLITDTPIQKPSYIKWIYLLSGAAVVSLVLGFFYGVSLLALVPIFFVNLVIHYKNKEFVTYYISAVSQLNKAFIVAKSLAQYKPIQTHFDDLSFINRVNSIGWKTKFISFEKQLSNEFQIVFWLFLELIKIQFNLESILFFSFVDAVEKEKPNIDRLFQFIGEIDAAIAVASVYASDAQVCQPVFTADKRLQVTEVAHPLVRDCITNDLVLDHKSLLLTGSNMSGKTTFIRSIAINTLLAQALSVCFAKEYSAPIMKIFSAIRIADDLLGDTSYYLQEVLTIKELIEASDDKIPCLFVLDEIFKGTNTVERISGGRAILSYLNKSQHFVLVSTHDIELTSLLEEEGFDLYHFTEKIKEDELLFDHKLVQGKLKTRNAIRILELYQYPKEVIASARKTEKEVFK